MTNRIRFFRAHVQQLNNAGVRRSLFYPLAAKSLRETAHEPIQMRRAIAEAYILDHAPLAVLPYELIVGSLSLFCPVSSAPDYVQQKQHGEAVLRRYIGEKRAGMQNQQRAGIRTFSEDFETKKSRWALMSRVHHDASISYAGLQKLIKEMKDLFYNQLEPFEIGRELERAFKLDYGEAKRVTDALPWFAANHLGLGYELALENGLRGLESMIKRGLKAATPEQQLFYRAEHIVLQAAQRFVLRYANAVSGEANRTPGTRGEELSHMAATLRKISTERADSFYEGVQLTYLLHIMMSMLGGSALSLGRFDQYLASRYQSDIESGNITEDEAMELLCCLWLKLNEPALRTVQSLTLGGVTPDGQDAANPLTSLCLKVIREMKLPYPNVGVRINRANPPWLMREVIDSITAGAGQPMIMNDDIWIENLIRLGHSYGDANNYYNMGCVEIMVPGKMPGWGVTDPIAFPMLLEQVFDKARTGAAQPQTFAQFLNDYLGELRHAVHMDFLEAQEKITDIPGKCFDPFASLLTEGCLASGRDMFLGGSALGMHWSFYAYGLGTAADALCAVKKWVFDRKQLTLDQLADALRGNFEGREQLRLLLTSAPHYGNDDDEVDQIAKSVLQCFDDAVFALNQPSARDKYVSTLFGYFFHIYHGEITGATPNGRKRGEAFSDSMGPSQGRDATGPTAMLNSVLKLDHSKVTGGYALNLKINPELVKDERGRAALTALIEAYLESGGPQIQVNFVDAEALKQAKQHPEQHADLIVRVGGYCEYFVNLDSSLQDEIIQRTVHGL